MNSSIQLARSLVDVAMGRQAADVVIRNGVWVCVQSGEMIPGTEIAIKAGHIAYVGSDASQAIGKKTRIIDAQGRFLVPGLLDAHVHVESSMVTITEFVRAVAPHGTTGIFIDPHEMANIFGLKGVKLMVDEAAHQPIHVWVEMPSCVPSAPGFETPGSAIGRADVAKAMGWPGIIGLGEMMNFPGVVRGDGKMLAEMTITHQANKTVGGHYASRDLGLPFHAYVAGGAEDDHEGTQVEDAVERVRQGMKPMLRYGSAWHDVASQVGAITKNGLEPRRFILCTDDSHAQTLAFDGHMDRVLRHAISQGLKPMVAIQMMTINTAEHFGLTREMGMIAPGRWADVVIAADFSNFKADIVLAKGKIVAEDGESKTPASRFKHPAWALNSVHLRRPVTAADFTLKAGTRNSEVMANVIGVIENQAPTRRLALRMRTKDGDVKPDPVRDIAKLAVIRRHDGLGGVSVGLVSGFGLKDRCAIASTIAHDCHHMIVVGTSEEDMAIAGNKLAKMGGGQIVVRNGQVIGLVKLGIAGLMSRDKVGAVARGAESVLAGFRSCGCGINNPNMQLSLLALPVIPELRLTDRGLVDVTGLKFVPVLQKD